MKVRVRAQAGAKRPKIEQVAQTPLPFISAELPTYKVAVTEPAVDGRANEAIVRALALHFDVPRSAVRLISGHTAKQKVFEVDGI